MLASCCSICRQPVENRADSLAGGPWDLCVCERCGRQRVLQDGGAALQLSAPLPGSRLDLGEIQIRPGAIHMLAAAGEHYWPYLTRHAQGNPGRFAPAPDFPEDSDSPRTAFLAGDGHVISEYRTKLGERLWIMTKPGKLTAVMAPGEY